MPNPHYTHCCVSFLFSLHVWFICCLSIFVKIINKKYVATLARYKGCIIIMQLELFGTKALVSNGLVGLHWWASEALTIANYQLEVD